METPQTDDRAYNMYRPTSYDIKLDSLMNTFFKNVMII